MLKTNEHEVSEQQSDTKQPGPVVIRRAVPGRGDTIPEWQREIEDEAAQAAERERRDEVAVFNGATLAVSPKIKTAEEWTARYLKWYAEYERCKQGADRPSWRFLNEAADLGIDLDGSGGAEQEREWRSRDDY